MMFKKSFFTSFLIFLFLILTIASELKAEINFDFGLPLFRQRDINFEKTKSADYNLQLLKKYILEHKDNVIAQYHAITRWFTLIKLSDKPKHAALIEEGNKYFSLEGKDKPTDEEKLRGIFYSGILLSNEKEDDPDCKKDQAFEEMLLEYEDELKEKADYWIAKGILFQVLKSRPNNYFAPMKPEEDLKIALTLIPRTSQYYYVMGQCFRFLGNSDSSLFLAIASYEKASSLDPRNPKLQNSLISIYMGLHEEYQSKGKPEPFWLEEAVYKKIIEIAPNNPYALNNLGYLYAEYGVNTKMAMELCQKAVSYNPENAGFQDSLGWAAFKNKKFELSEKALLKSISLKTNVYESRYHLATLYYTTGDYEKAAEQYEYAIRLKPESAEALNNLAYLYTELKINNEKALSMAKTANQLESNNASYLDTLGWAYYRNGDIDNALIYLQKANGLVPAQGEILLHIGRVYLEKNDFDKALTYVKEAFKTSPDLNDPDDTLYLTIRLKAYHEAMANYHGLLGKRADKNKVMNILMDISRLYQEEGLYDKSIEITKICSELNSGAKSLEEPLLDSYKVTYKEKSKEINNPSNEEESKEETKPSASVEQPVKEIENPSDNKDSKVEEINRKDLLPKDADCPVAISFCSGFFKSLQKYLPNIKELSKCNVTLILDRFFFPNKTVIVRITSNSVSGKDLRDGIAAAYGKNASLSTNKDDSSIELFAVGKCYCKVLDNAVYISFKEITDEDVKILSKILPFREGYFMELYYDNQAFHNRFSKYFRPFIRNPFKPFERIAASYQIEKGGINEFIVGTTGKKENDDFMKKMAARLFRFKVKKNKRGLNTTIKLQSEGEMIYITTEYDNFFAWINKKVDSVAKKVSRYLPFFDRFIPKFK